MHAHKEGTQKEALTLGPTALPPEELGEYGRVDLQIAGKRAHAASPTPKLSGA
jgi:hypothetical protein